MMSKKIVTWDLGATKCAAALVEWNQQSNAFECVKKGSIKVRSCESLPDLTAKIEELLGIKTQDADAVCIGAAGQYDGKSLYLEKGYPYEMNFAEHAEKSNWPPFDVIHDYSPIVCATFTDYVNEPSAIRKLNTAPLNPKGRRVALGVGTGVGLKDGVLFENGDFWLGTNELGHIGVTAPPLANSTERLRHHEFIHFLHRDGILAEDEPLTFEKILAANGMVRLHAFFDSTAKGRSAEEIGALVREGKAEETLSLFAWYLGLLVGTVQLSFMPDGGIWLTGGVVSSHMEAFDRPEFYQGIEASPTYMQLREKFPLNVLCGDDHAFIGAAYYAAKRLM